MSGARWGVPLAALVLVGGVWLALLASSHRSGVGRMAPELGAPGAGSAATGYSLSDFVEVPAGPFLMGSSPDRDPQSYDIERWGSDGGMGTLHLPTYRMGRTEVTVARYAAFVRATGHPVPEPATLAAPADHPVTQISWPDAIAYARWVDRSLRGDSGGTSGGADTLASLLRSGWRITLPDEAHWEKAARGTDGRIYPWGDAFQPERVATGSGRPHPAGALPCPECAHGLADMSGNVWEWTSSPYQPYPFDPSDDGSTVDADALWVIRGGSFADGPQNLRAAVRGGADPGARRSFIGFRLALLPPDEG